MVGLPLLNAVTANSHSTAAGRLRARKVLERMPPAMIKMRMIVVMIVMIRMRMIVVKV